MARKAIRHNKRAKQDEIDPILHDDDIMLALGFLLDLLDEPQAISQNTKPSLPASTKQRTRKQGVRDFSALFEKYRKNRKLLSQFNVDMFEPCYIPESIVESTGQLLGISYLGSGAIDTSNEMELNVFYNHCILYTDVKDKPFIVDFLERHPRKLQGARKEVLTALMQARFTILRFDEFYNHGAIKVFDLLEEKHYLLIDQALHRTGFENQHLVLSLLDMQEYVMTSGAAIPFDPDCPGGQKLLVIFSNYVSKIKGKPSRKQTLQCARDIYRYCISTGAMTYHTVNEVI